MRRVAMTAVSAVQAAKKAADKITPVLARSTSQAKASTGAERAALRLEREANFRAELYADTPQVTHQNARAARRREGFAGDKRARSRAGREIRKWRGEELRKRVKAREDRELAKTGTYELPLLAARTAVGRLRRFRNDGGKLVRLA